MPKSEDQEYVDALAESWQQTYKKSLTTILILLCLQEKAMWSKDIAVALENRTKGNITLDEKSLHRALRRLTRQDVIEVKTAPGVKTGALRKIYSLTATGQALLQAISRNYIDAL